MSMRRGAAATLDAALRRAITTGSLRIPLLPENAQRIVALASAADADGRKLAALIQHDATISGHTLRLANSPVYRASSPIVSVPQALVRLGFQRIREVALAIAAKTALFRVPGFEPELARQFRHAFASALVAQRIARELGENGEDAFSAGLFHDVGKPLLLQASVDLRENMDDRATILDTTERLHAEAGVRVLGMWGQPMRIQQVVRHHHDSLPPREVVRSVRILQLSDALADAVIDEREDAAESLCAHPALAALDLHSSRMLRWLEFARRTPETIDAVV